MCENSHASLKARIEKLAADLEDAQIEVRNLGNMGVPALKARIEQTEGALREIMKATVEGRVCDDVAWFDSITTLHDFCDLVLNGPGEVQP
jgi:intracellular sulfur oxidation DsrE/DsrF family protein